MAGLEELSKRICRQLDCTGYSMKMIQIRRKVYRAWSRTLSSNLITAICSGSRGEGITKLHESDLDCILLVAHVVCVDSLASVRQVPAHMTVFNVLNIQSGYCMVELVRKDSNTASEIEDSLVPYNGKVMLSSQAIKIEHNGSKPNTATTSTMTGPAQKSIFPSGLMIDNVLTLSCCCRAILEEWFNRPRTIDWPPLSVRQTVVQMNGNLVATGRNDSEIEHLEWRYCFNEIDLLIMQSLNDTQLKLYKVLKIINKDIFKKYGHSITSFMMKNIVLWMAETHPQSQFLPETLYHNVSESLRLLKHFVETNNIPYYMIPGRNLLTEKVKESDKPKLLTLISDVIDSCPVMLLGCETIRRYDSLTVPELGVLKQKLETLELNQLYIANRSILLNRQGQDRTQDALLRCLGGVGEQILRFGWPSLIQQQIANNGTELAIRDLLS